MVKHSSIHEIHWFWILYAGVQLRRVVILYFCVCRIELFVGVGEMGLSYSTINKKWKLKKSWKLCHSNCPASWDPTFWPLHGSIERLIGLKRIELLAGNTTFNTTWDYDYSSNLFYLAGECDWSAVTSSDDLTLPTCMMGSGNGTNTILLSAVWLIVYTVYFQQT